MYTSYWGTQKQFIYSSRVGDGKGQHDQLRKHSQPGSCVSHVEVKRYEETINHYTTAPHDLTLHPPSNPAAFSSFHGTTTNTAPAAYDDLAARKDEFPEEEEDEVSEEEGEEKEEVARPSSPSSALELMDPKTRWLFVHFLTQISPYCIILDDDNGFRSHVLPFAVQCPLVRRAVCVTAAFHLSEKVPSLRADAEIGRGIVIKMLQEIALQNKRIPNVSGSDPPTFIRSSPGTRFSPAGQHQVFAESSWCCLILLIVGDLITGSADIMALRKTLVSFREGRKKEWLGKGPLVEFLEYQSGLIEFVARPMSSKPGQDACESFLLDHRKYRSSPAIQATITQYNQCFKIARRVYHYRLQQATLTPEQLVELNQLSQDLKAILMFIDGNVPGSHAPLWPCFVAGCEATDQAERDFFYARLETIWVKTWSRNPFVAMKGLLYIWSLGPNVNWAERVSDLDRKRDSLVK